MECEAEGVLAVQVESRWQVIQMLSLLAFGGAKISHQERIAGSVGPGALSQADKCMTGMPMYLPGQPSLQGARAAG